MYLYQIGVLLKQLGEEYDLFGDLGEGKVFGAWKAVSMLIAVMEHVVEGGGELTERMDWVEDHK